MPSFSARLAVAATLCFCGLTTPASAQRLDTAVPPPSAPGSGTAAERYEPVFDALRNMAPRADSVALVRNVSLRRDAIQFQLGNKK